MAGTHHVQRRTSQSIPLALLLSAAAGSIEAYSVIHLGAFAGAQTGNVILASVGASQLHWAEAARFFWPIIAFIGAVVLAQTLLTQRLTRVLRRPYRAILTLELVAMAVVGLLPASAPHTIASIIVTVAVAAQASTFRTVVDVGYNSAFTTGNLMNAVAAAHSALVTHNQTALRQARRIGAVIVTYAFGAVIGGLSTHRFGGRGVLCGAVLLAMALLLFVADEQRSQQSVPE